MHPIQLLRKKDPTLRHALARRPDVIDWDVFDQSEVLRHAAQQELEAVRNQRRVVAEQAAAAKRAGDSATFDALVAQGSEIAVLIPALEATYDRLEREQQAWVQQLPNAPGTMVPQGAGEHDNRVVRVVGDIPTAAHLGEDHVTVAKPFGAIDAQKGANLSGSRFSVMGGQIARLHRALIQMMLDLHGEAGYEEINVPYLVKGDALFGTGQLPKFEDDLFRTQDDLYLIPTAEVPLTNLVAGQVLNLQDLPLAWCAHTPCFRREAGSAGKDVHGLIRQHQAALGSCTTSSMTQRMGTIFAVRKWRISIR